MIYDQRSMDVNRACGQHGPGPERGSGLMTAVLPSFCINDEIINLVAEISELIGIVSACAGFSPTPRLERERRILSVYSSLAIDYRNLTLDHVTAIINGESVPELASDILAVKNAYDAYMYMHRLDSTKMEDLLMVNRLLMQDLSPAAGSFRTGNYDVFEGERLIRAGVPADDVPEMIGQLFDWLRTSRIHPLIRGCIFQYAFEFIHPFSDGNGRTARLWHSMILQRWRPALSWLPVKNFIHVYSEEYHQALKSTNGQGECTDFILFMLPILRNMLLDLRERMRSERIMVGRGLGNVVGAKTGREHGKMTGEESGGTIRDFSGGTVREYEDFILTALKNRPDQTAWKISATSGISPRIVEKILKGLRKQGRLIHHEEEGNSYWEIVDQT